MAGRLAFPKFGNKVELRVSYVTGCRFSLFPMQALRFVLALGFSFAALLVAQAEPITPTPAPAWKLKDVNGKVVSSDTFKGKVVVIDFWATWCPPCRAEMPGYTELQKKYGKKGLVIVGISLDEAGPAAVKSFIEKNKIGYPIVMADEEVVKAFGGVEVLPTTFIIDREGKIRERKEGAEETEAYEKRIKLYLK
jgi:thiol-disulfide isomerase/thioredoxin